MTDDECSINYDNIITQMEESGILDEDAMLDAMLELHTIVSDAHLQADNPETYRTMIATLSLLMSMLEETSIDNAIEWVGRTSVRALRDLTRR